MVTDCRDNSELLAPFRVLDLTDEKGFACGAVLGLLGADVVKIERPGGDGARKQPPFFGDEGHSEESLYWSSFNTNKRSITLDVKKKSGQDILRRLCQKADILVESMRPGLLEEIGLGWPALSRINPRLVVTSITPFGQTGPYAQYEVTDIVCQAMGGQMYPCGDPDRPPLRITTPVAYAVAGLYAVGGTLIAHYHRQLTGEGQHVDVSIQECICWTTSEAAWSWPFVGAVTSRFGARRKRPTGLITREVYPCKDGHVAFYLMGGPQGEKSVRALMDWIDEEGMVSESLRRKDWAKFDYESVSQDELDAIEGVVEKFFQKHTKEELYQKRTRKSIQLYPVNTLRDIVEDKQLKARGFWDDVQGSTLNLSKLHPGALFQASETPLKHKRAAPGIGEHNREIYTELGLTDEDLSVLLRENVI